MNKFGVLISIFICANAEKFLLAKDDAHQVEIYGPHTVIQSWIIDTDLYGLFMNSFIGVQTTKFLVANDIKSPYTVFQVNNVLHVISTGDHGLAILNIGKHSEKLDFETGRRIKFDYLTQKVYTQVNDTAIGREFGSFEQSDIKLIENMTDFYVQDGKITQCPGEQCRELELVNHKDKNFIDSTPIILFILVLLTAIGWLLFLIFRVYIIPIYKNELQILRR